jgi:hypothetical protein
MFANQERTKVRAPKELEIQINRTILTRRLDGLLEKKGRFPANEVPKSLQQDIDKIEKKLNKLNQ